VDRPDETECDLFLPETATSLLAQRRSPDNIAAARMSCSGEAFSIPEIERSTRRWQRSRD
jgi:hypothetical protein